MASSKENLFILTPINFKEEKVNSAIKSPAAVEHIEKYDPLIFCRTCANMDPCLVPIFKEEGLDYSLNKKIEKYLPIQVSEEDDLPVHLCYHCASTLIAWDSLLVGCVEAEKKLMLLKSSLGDKECETVVEDVDSLINESIDSDDEPLISKKAALKIKKIQEKKDILQEKSDLQTLEPLEVQSERLMEEPDLSFSTYQHQFTMRRPFISQILKLRIENPFCCNTCTAIKNLRLDFKSSLKRSKTVEEKPAGSANFGGKKRKKRLKPKERTVCNDCGKILSSSQTLKNHMKTHRDEKTLSCHLCGKVFKHRFNLLRHLRVIHEGVRNHVCTDCGKRYRSHGEMEDHRNVHNVQRKIICEECGRVFLTRASFYPHKKFHRMKKLKKETAGFDCEKCRKKFTTKKSRDQHLLIHTGEKPLGCTVCGKKFRTKANFTQHVRVHSDVKPYGCEHCGKTFGRKDHLRIHVRRHTGEKPFVCNYCGKCFAQMNDMKKHCRIHEKKVNCSVVDCHKKPSKADENVEDSDESGKETPLEGQDTSSDWDAIPKSWLTIISCKHCGKISCAPKHLRQHERRGTCTKNFQCKDCGQLFAKELNFLKHAKRHQKESSSDKIKRFSCRTCNKKFKFEDNGLAHEKICGKTESVHKCSVCGKRFETKTLADQHWTSHHKSCVCHMCGQSFSKPESLKQHVKTVHEEFKMVCHYCGKEFSRKARLQEHLQRHTGQMDFTCHVCGKGSTNAYSFGVHLATHSQETPFSCSFCPRTFKHMKYVYLHERSVHLKLKSGKTYVKPKKPGKNVAQRTCSLCNKTFKRESAMLIHKRSVHEGKNGYICKLCGKDFKYTYLLYVHKKKHHFPELCKYVCEFCEKPFPVKTELQNHLRKHTGEKPYICGVCGKTYSFHGSLNMHMKTQHENKKNYKCNICGSSYNFQSHLSRHMSVHVQKYPEVLSSELCQN